MSASASRPQHNETLEAESSRTSIMAAPESGSQYSDTLNTESFRLLRIESTQASPDVEPVLNCRLTTYKFGHSPPYAALSYAWKEPQASPPHSKDVYDISVNDQVIQVGANLYYALLEITRQTTLQVLQPFWIDAICINQSSIAERTAQVSMMDRIYGNATQVVVWLGPDLEGEVYVVREFLRALLAKYYEEAYATGSDASTKYPEGFLAGKSPKDLEYAMLPPIRSEIWKRVIRFSRRGWFSRIWVLQEVALACRGSFWCGGTKFTLRELYATSDFFIRSHLIHLLREQVRNDVQEQVCPLLIGSNVLLVNEYRHWIRTKSNDFTTRPTYFVDFLAGPMGKKSHSHTKVLGRSLCMMLWNSRGRECTDPRDRVFALLGLVKQLAENRCLPPPSLRVDYNKDLAEVYREATGYVINTTGWLGILSLLDPMGLLAEDSNKCSWTPDFSVEAPTPNKPAYPKARERVYQHLELVTPSTRPYTKGFELCVSATKIGKVEDVGDSRRAMFRKGLYETTAKLLLKLPDIVDNHGYTCIDYWNDTLEGKLDCRRSDVAIRANLSEFLSYCMRQATHREILAGRLKQGSCKDCILKMPSFLELADRDSTRTLHNMADWSLPSADNTKIHEPRGMVWRKFKYGYGRKIFRLITSDSSCRPGTSILGMAPEAVRPGDVAFNVIGSVLPLILRPDPEVPCRARVVGQAFITYLDGTEPSPELEDHERWTLV